jgi:hypothetical protein
MKIQIAAFAALGGLLFMTTGCTTSQETAVLNDIQAIVNLAASVLSVAQSFGALETPQEQSDMTEGEQYAKNLSAAASASITEWNSTDPIATKVNVITADFTAVAPIGTLQTARINAAVQLLSAAVNLAIAQLKSAAPAASSNAIPVQLHANRIAAFIPGTFTHRLNAVKKKADGNVALATKLLAVR